MNYKELIIGDIVNIKCLNIEDEEVFLPGKIVSVGEDFVSAIAIYDTYQFECPEIFEGVPLTAEILEKNRFIWKEDNGYFALWLNDQDGIFATPTRNGMWNVQAQSSQFKISCNICYLHVLQHILRLFGLGDIADNFKI